VICPHCNSVVDDNALVCPACHADLDGTASIPKLANDYCPSCGALVPEDASACPKCGMPHVPREPLENPRRQLAMSIPDPANEEDGLGRDVSADVTNALPRIESAIPSEEDVKNDVRREKPLRMRVIVVAVVASALLVTGTVLAITHPWDPNALNQRATEDADTSLAGFPGTVDKLSGQDSTGEDDTEILTADEYTYNLLNGYHEDLGSLYDRVQASEERLRTDGITSDEAERQAGKAECDAIAIDVSNLITKIQSVDVTSGTYATSLSELVTMANYLRNEVDACVESWNLDVESADPAAEKGAILKAVRGSGASNATLFKNAWDSYTLADPVA
jgi:RNA polymerase subunit RPABC4/transcription elongation factor Spt4